MISLQIIDVKDFMSKLLISDTFHKFLLSEAIITTYNSFTIDGHINKDFYTAQELEENNISQQSMSYWEALKPFCFELIKGKKTPLSFKIVFVLSQQNVSRLLDQSGVAFTEDDINGLFLNIRYSGNTLLCTTGTSLKLFTLDKSLENEWDLLIQKYFKTHEIPFEIK